MSNKNLENPLNALLPEISIDAIFLQFAYRVQPRDSVPNEARNGFGNHNIELPASTIIHESDELRSVFLGAGQRFTGIDASMLQTPALLDHVVVM